MRTQAFFAGILAVGVILKIIGEIGFLRDVREIN